MSTAQRKRNRHFRQKLRWHLFLREAPGRLTKFVLVNRHDRLPWWVLMERRDV